MTEFESLSWDDFAERITGKPGSTSQLALTGRVTHICPFDPAVQSAAIIQIRRNLTKASSICSLEDHNLSTLGK
jgi:hypothetical protein